MKKKLKKCLGAVIASIFVFTFFKNPYQTFAQTNYFTCQEITGGWGCTEIPGGKGNHCLPGYAPYSCSTFNNAIGECKKIHNCIPEKQVSKCIGKVGLHCPSDFPSECPDNICCKEKSDCGIVETRIKNICVDIPDGESKKNCEKCFLKGQTWTALGCIPTDNLNNLVAWLLGRLIFIATGIAFILLVIGALQILTSAGNPEKVKAGSELITSTISGLLLIILSLFLLKLIGVDILQIPGFSK